MLLIHEIKNNIYNYSYARGVGSDHISTSAKTGAGVIELF